MDEMFIKLNTSFMRNIVKKLISRSIYKKFGYDISLELNEMEISNKGSKIHFHIDANAEIDSEDFARIVSAGLKDETD